MGQVISGLSSMATQHVLAELAETYRLQSGTAVAVATMGGPDAANRVRAGEACDFVALAPELLAKLAREGHVVAASVVPIATSGVALAVRANAPMPDIRTEAAVREAVAAAPAVGYSTGPSGVYLVKLFERWGIRPNLVQAPPGVAVGSLVARGDVTLGFQQMSELIHVEGITIVGPLPREIQLETTFAGAVCTASREPRAATAFLAFVASTAAAECKRRHGMSQPATRA